MKVLFSSLVTWAATPGFGQHKSIYSRRTSPQLDDGIWPWDCVTPTKEKFLWVSSVVHERKRI